jgi:osmoprotectant transport system permease protein
MLTQISAMWSFVLDPTNDFIGETISFVQLCGVGIAVAVLIGVVLGVAVSRNSVLAFIAVNLSGIMRAIPVIAFLIAVLPYLGVGFRPSVVALIILGIPPVLLNTLAGIRGIDPAIIDAAKGMGMTNLQIVWSIQTPLVLPILAAGVRTSAVQIIATAPLAAYINGRGYGDYIVDGLNLFNTTEILVGALAVAVLAIIVEVFMSWLQRLLTPMGLRVREAGNVAKAS